MLLTFNKNKLKLTSLDPRDARYHSDIVNLFDCIWPVIKNMLNFTNKKS
jgi:hypothetical protein